MNLNEHTIILVEDSDEDYLAFCRIFKQIHLAIDHVNIVRYTNGDDAIKYLLQCGSSIDQVPLLVPTLILLDLNLPGTDGRVVLTQIKGDVRLCSIPLIVFTTSSNPRDVQDCYARGANGYLIKNVNYEAFKHSIRLLAEYWFTVNVGPNTEEINLREEV